MKKRYLDFILAAVLLVGAAALTQIKADKPFLFLLPSPGITNQIEVAPDQTYQYTFKVTKPIALSRLGFYFSPSSLPNESLKLSISQAGTIKGQSELSAVFIDSDGASLWQFNPPIKLEANKDVTASFEVPAAFANKLKIKTRLPDASFRANETQLTIAEKIQPTILAYEVYAGYVPPLAPQLAVIAVVTALYLILKPRHSFLQEIGIVMGALALTAAYLFPVLSISSMPWFLLVIQTGAAVAMFWFMRGRGFHAISAAAAAAIVSYGSWFPLQYSGGRFLYGLIVPAAFLVITLSKSQPTIRRRLAACFALGLAIFLFTLPFELGAFTYNVEGYSNLRDVLLDPYQVPHAEKAISTNSSPIPWHNFGAYIGIPAILAAIIGIFSAGQKHPRLLGTTLLLAILLSLHLPAPFALIIAHSSIIVVVLLAYFAALGLENIRRFLGYEDKLVRILVTLVTLIIMLDLWHTVSDVLSHL